MKIILLYGLRRSGNHFLISTILQQYTNYVHINDVRLSYLNFEKYKNIDKNKSRIDNEWTGFKGVECVVISMENKMIDFDILDAFHKIKNCYSIILLRCPYSNFASNWKVYNKNYDKLIEIIKLWKIYANIYIDDNKLIKVLYDEFAVNNIYIINILQKLNINILKINTNEYIQYQDSSFKDENENKKRINDTITSCVYKNDTEFIKLIDDVEIYNLWNIIIQ